MVYIINSPELNISNGKSYQRVIREKLAITKSNQSSYMDIPIKPCLDKSYIKRIDFNTASKIILQYEWIGTMPLPKSCRYIFGQYFDDVLGGVIVYVEPSTRQFNKLYPRQVLQLNRGACAYWTPKNSASKLISQSLKDLKNDEIKLVIAYCTPEAGEIGTIYQALGWWYVGDTSPSKVYFLDGHWISERTLADKVKWAKNKEIRWQDKFKNLEFRRLSGKYKYIKLLGSKQENDKIIELFGFKSLAYPKRDGASK
jgi:hypothetical protein